MHPDPDAPTGRPRRAGVDLHPGSRDAPRAKRTSEQKQADDAKAAAQHSTRFGPCACSQADNDSRQTSQIESRRRGGNVCGRTSRSCSVNGQDDDELDDFELGLMAASDAPGPATSDFDELQSGEDEDNSNDDDDQYEEDSEVEGEENGSDSLEDEEDEEELAVVAHKGAKKSKRGVLHAKVLYARQIPSARPSTLNPTKNSKRKNLEDLTENPEPPKRVKKTEGGLRPEWTKSQVVSKRSRTTAAHAPTPPVRVPSNKPTVPRTSQAQAAPTTSSTNHADAATLVAGPSAQPQDTTAAVSVPQQKAHPLPAATVGRSRQVNVVRVPKNVEDGSGRTKKGKQRWTQDHLPFPGGHARANCLRIWRNQFTFTVISWAGSQDDPFGTNATVDEAVNKIWPVLYSQLALDNSERPAVIGNVRVILNLWRNHLGNKAMDTLWDIWAEMGIDNYSDESKEARKEYVKEQLKDNRFAYKDFDAPPGQRGTFCTRLILSAFALHLKTMEDSSADAALDFTNTHGALGLAAAAAERALKVCRHGMNALKDTTKDELKTLQRLDPDISPFKSNPWGSRAADYATSAKNLPSSNWDDIYEEAAALAGVVGGDEEYDEDSDGDGDGDGVRQSRSALLL